MDYMTSLLAITATLEVLHMAQGQSLASLDNL